MAKILLVDDSPLLIKIGASSLEKMSHKVLTAKDGKEAIEKAKKEKPDIIFMDAEMPELDGWQACFHIKNEPTTQNIPVYICTGHDMTEESNQKLSSVGANGFIQKPYKPEDLEALIP